jgi:hypothetical protein
MINMERQGKPRKGIGIGLALGMARQGKARKDMERKGNKEMQGMERKGKASWHGKSRKGRKRLEMAWNGKARHGKIEACQGMARHGKSRKLVMERKGTRSRSRFQGNTQGIKGNSR